MLTWLTSGGYEERRTIVGTIARRFNAPGMRTFGASVLAFAVMTFAGGRAWAQDSVLPLAMPEGNLVAVGVGAYPDYVGSDDYSIGAIPLARYLYWGRRDLTLIGNTLSMNLLDASGWRLGPSGMLRSAGPTWRTTSLTACTRSTRPSISAPLSATRWSATIRGSAWA